MSHPSRAGIPYQGECWQAGGGCQPQGMHLLVHDDAGCDPAAGLALDEALARAGPQRPLLRLWRCDRAVLIGRAQRPEREADLAACAQAAVPVLRRSSGGGAVYADLGNLNISLAAPGADRELAGRLAGLVAGAVRRLGLPARITPRGVHVGAAKVSGLASQVTRSGSLAHATVLVTTPAATVAAFLAPAPSDPRPTDSRRSPVAPLRDLSPDIDLAVALAALLAETRRQHGPLVPRPLHEPERRWQERLLAQRYRSDTWHLTGQTKEAPWTTRPVLTSTG